MTARFAFLVGILLPLASVCRAELAVMGRVVDENNAAVAGARIVFRPASPISGNPEYEAQADPTGVFSVTVPGRGDYLASADHEGYFQLKDLPVQIADPPLEIHLVLNHVREFFQAVSVTASPSPIDVEQTASERRLTGLQILNVPYPSTRSLRNAMRLMPGVIQDSTGELHFNGSAENQVLYTLNDFNISDPLTGRFDTRLSVDAVRSLRYSTGRFSPEFGKGSAGALAIQTEAGDDQLRYSGTNFIPGVDTKKGLHLGTWSPRLGLSGPIVKGRAWFSDHLEGEYSQLVVQDLPKGEDRNSSTHAGNLLHAQVNLTPANILYTDFLVNYGAAGSSGLGALDPPSTTTDRRSRTWFFSFKDQIYIARGTLLELGYGENRTFARMIPKGHDLYLLTPNGRRGNFFVDSTQTSRRDQFLANLFLPSFQFRGNHQLKTGIDLDRLNYWQNIRRTGYEQYGLSGNLLRRTNFSGNGRASRPSAEFSSYVLDAWSVKANLLVEIGVRQDWDELVRRVAFSPRASFSYAPLGSKNTKIAGGYAIIYEASNLELFARPRDQYSLTTTFGPDGTVWRGPAVTIFTICGSRLKAPRSQNWSLGVSRRLPRSIDLSFNVLRRRGENGFTYQNILGTHYSPSEEVKRLYRTSLFDGVYNLTNFRRDVYDSAELTLHQPLREEYEWMASYTRSRALSNAVLNLSVDEVLRVGSNVGRLGWDSPNRFLSWGYLPSPWKDWAWAYLLELRNGFPFSVQRENGELVGGVNPRRFPANLALNLHLERRMHLWGYRFALRGGFNNITNHKNPTVVNNILGSPRFLTYYGSEGRHFVFRLRWLGRSGV